MIHETSSKTDRSVWARSWSARATGRCASRRPGAPGVATSTSTSAHAQASSWPHARATRIRLRGRGGNRNRWRDDALNNRLGRRRLRQCRRRCVGNATRPRLPPRTALQRKPQFLKLRAESQHGSLGIHLGQGQSANLPTQDHRLGLSSLCITEQCRAGRRADEHAHQHELPTLHRAGCVGRWIDRHAPAGLKNGPCEKFRKPMHCVRQPEFRCNGERWHGGNRHFSPASNRRLQTQARLPLPPQRATEGDSDQEKTALCPGNGTPVLRRLACAAHEAPPFIA